MPAALLAASLLVGTVGVASAQEVGGNRPREVKGEILVEAPEEGPEEDPKRKSDPIPPLAMPVSDAASLARVPADVIERDGLQLVLDRKHHQSRGVIFSTRILSCNCKVGNIEPEGIQRGSITCQRRSRANATHTSRPFQLLRLGSELGVGAMAGSALAEDRISHRRFPDSGPRQSAGCCPVAPDPAATGSTPRGALSWQSLRSISPCRRWLKALWADHAQYGDR